MAEESDRARWAIEKAEELLSVYLNQEQKAINLPSFAEAIAKALDEAYEEGLTAGQLAAT